MVNITRWKNRPVINIKYDAEEVPTGPDKALLEDVKKEGNPHPTALAKKVLALLEDRPMWTRVAILNQLDAEERRIAIK